ncbi:hypothetical protein DF16_pBMB2062orf00001 (plasmid) [Bacillus thuringiensis serovar kurstaki str. YBT-1520]|nr:hypothetical protein DF16_pBMB2062orf00001 [Bacillus thuringiensis serovar kurstaki str. YBT-1520]
MWIIQSCTLQTISNSISICITYTTSTSNISHLCIKPFPFSIDTILSTKIGKI